MCRVHALSLGVLQVSKAFAETALAEMRSLDTFNNDKRVRDFVDKLSTASIRSLEDEVDRCNNAAPNVNTIDLFKLFGSAAAGKALPRYELPVELLDFKPTALTEAAVAEMAAEFKRMDDLVVKYLSSLSSNELRALVSITRIVRPPLSAREEMLAKEHAATATDSNDDELALISLGHITLTPEELQALRTFGWKGAMPVHLRWHCQNASCHSTARAKQRLRTPYGAHLLVRAPPEAQLCDR